MPHADAEPRDPRRPERLVDDLRHHHLRRAGPGSRGRGPGAAMVHHRCHAREQRLLVHLADDEAIVAVIGASSDRTKFGNKAVRAYLKHGWTVYPIHPKEKTIEGVAAFASIRDVPPGVQRIALYVQLPGDDRQEMKAIVATG